LPPPPGAWSCQINPPRGSKERKPRLGIATSSLTSYVLHQLRRPPRSTRPRSTASRSVQAHARPGEKLTRLDAAVALDGTPPRAKPARSHGRRRRGNRVRASAPQPPKSPRRREPSRATRQPPLLGIAATPGQFIECGPYRRRRALRHDHPPSRQDRGGTVAEPVGRWPVTRSRRRPRSRQASSSRRHPMDPAATTRALAAPGIDPPGWGQRTRVASSALFTGTISGGPDRGSGTCGGV
jgi:hypothetical protein